MNDICWCWKVFAVLTQRNSLTFNSPQITLSRIIGFAKTFSPTALHAFQPALPHSSLNTRSLLPRQSCLHSWVINDKVLILKVQKLVYSWEREREHKIVTVRKISVLVKNYSSSLYFYICLSTILPCDSLFWERTLRYKADWVSGEEIHFSVCFKANKTIKVALVLRCWLGCISNSPVKSHSSHFRRKEQILVNKPTAEEKKKRLLL